MKVRENITKPFEFDGKLVTFSYSQQVLKMKAIYKVKITNFPNLMVAHTYIHTHTESIIGVLIDSTTATRKRKGERKI